MSTLASAERAPALLRLIDRPALSALQLARGPGRQLGLPAAVGFGLCTLGAALADLVTPGPTLALAGLRALLEAAAVVVPTTLILGTYLRMRVLPRAFLASTGLGLLTAGIVGLSLLPLFAFSVVAAAGELPFYALPAVVMPGAFVAATSLVSIRVLRTLDPSPAGRLVSAGFGLLLVAAFFIRFWPALHAARTGGF